MSLTATVDAATDRFASLKEEGSKYHQILDGARDVILKHGFDAASMNEIARVAGVSKGTLYVYFSSKEELFEALIRGEKRAQAEQLCRFDEASDDLPETLAEFGFRLLDLMLQPSSIAHLRTVAAVSAKFPQIGRAYYEAGPLIGIRRLADYLRLQADRGIVEIDHFEIAAGHFIELCKSLHLMRAIFSAGERPTDAELRAHVAEAVRRFLRAYAAGAVATQ